ncbi:MAG: 4-(cytidine 5'-diphospho)-2-C-methyl-D-erythritol kinase [Deltaproteobacteria bacterium]|nr:4-(cytidine 5'-diphospho)-2-C-methyl-D-erythritol kinase [Deltaproteobacteria bacterium]
MKSIRVRAPAKINLFLRVLKRREDGYHELETLFQAIDLWDELVVRKGVSRSRLEVPGRPDLERADNLVLKALLWLEKRTEARRPVDIRLMKRIPVAAGLGGGSSDAAATLLAVCRLFDLPLTEQDLLDGARELGADVSFFLKGGTAVGEGIGDRLTPAQLSLDYELVLLNPGFAVSTAAVYREFSRTLTEGERRSTLWKLLRKGCSVSCLLHNDLQSVAEKLYPEIAQAQAFAREAASDAVLMSGSGPTVFGLVDREAQQIRAVRRRLPAQWTMTLTKPVNLGVVID